MKRTWSKRQEGESSQSCEGPAVRNSRFGQLGIIENVNLRNFMCHDNLSFDFDPHMNFIVGLNGSGKSAVLTAIILALGGKSGATGRYSNIKGFIKTGKSSATVSVTLKNCGPDAYKPEEFGEKIIVERHFTSEGISSYKLKSQAGRIISTSREELKNILNVMDIQIENPITVLTQEISRNFLVSKNSKGDKLFQLFFRGTGLAKVQEDYNRSLQQVEEMKSELSTKKAILPEMEKELKKIKSLLDKKSKISELKNELLWANVIEFEKRRDAAKEALEKAEKDQSVWKKKLNMCETELNNVQQSVAAAKADKKDSIEKMDSMRKDLQELTQKRSSLTSEIREIMGTKSSHERQLKKYISEIQSLETIISEIKMKNESDVNEGKLRHEMVVNNLKNEVNNMQHQIEMLNQKKNCLCETATRTEKKIENFHVELQEINYAMINVKKEKQQLVDGMSNRINVYGPEMINVLQDIKRAVQSHLFRREPIGPIGLHINVKQPDWNFAVQECLKSGFLRTFLCDNIADADTLTKILNKHYQRNRPSIITSKFVSEVYDVSSYKTVCDHPTLLDILDVEDPVVTNCLIDQKRIENILLIANEVEARKLMLYNPPQNCSFAYTPNGDQYCHSPYRNFSCRNMNQICMLKTVNEEDIRKKDEELMALEEAKSSKIADREALIQQLRLNEQEINKVDNEITDLKIKLKHTWMKLKEEENVYEEPKDINCLQIDLEQLQQQMKRHEDEYTSFKTLLSQKEQELHSLNTNIKEFQEMLQDESRKVHSFSTKVGECESKKEKLDSAIKKINDQLKQMEPVLKEKKQELETAVATLKLSTKAAMDTYPDRIETKRSPETILQILEETEKFIQKQRSYDQQALFQEYEEKNQNFISKKAELSRLERLNVRINDMLKERFVAFKKTCDNTDISLTCTFSYLLKENNFTGYPRVDFNHQTLEIFAKPDKDGSKPDESNNLSQLSGGERSYVTIAFLLSLWDRINMPFRILDEYDVFMDSTNRHLSINTLVNTAKTNKKIQYIFLSPLELPDIADSDCVKVHKMPAPRK